MIVDSLASLGAFHSPSLVESLVPELAIQVIPRERVIQDLAFAGRNALMPLTLALDDADQSLRSGAAAALDLIGPDGRDALAALKRHLMNDPDSDVRLRCAMAISRIDPSDNVPIPALVEGLGHRDWRVGREVIDRLASLRASGNAAPELLRGVEEKLGEERWDVASRAAECLGKMGERAASAVPALIEALRHPVVNVRMDASEALANIGEPARSAIPHLERVVLRDPNFNASDAARAAPARLREPDPETLQPILPLVESLYSGGGAHKWGRPERAVIESLGSLGAKGSGRAIQGLIRIMKSAHFDEARLLAAEQLLAVGARAVPVLVDALARDEWQPLQLEGARSPLNPFDPRYQADGLGREVNRSTLTPRMIPTPRLFDDIMQASGIGESWQQPTTRRDGARLGVRCLALLSRSDELVPVALAARADSTGDGRTTLIVLQAIAAAESKGWPTLIRLATSDSVPMPTRLMALDAASTLRMGSSMDRGWLEGLLASQSVDLRMRALRIIRRCGPQPAGIWCLVLPLLTDPSPEVRQAAAYALAGCEGLRGEALAGLVQLGSDTEAPVCAEAWRSMAALMANPGGRQIDAPASLLSALDRGLNDGYLPVRLASARAISQLPPRQAAAFVPKLIPSLGSGDGLVESAVIEALGRIGTDAVAASPGLVSVIVKDRDYRRDWSGRVPFTVEALASIGRGVVPAVLRPLTERPPGMDSWWDTNLTRVLAETSADDASSIPVLVALLTRTKGQDGEYLLRYYAASACRGLGTNGGPCVPILAETLKDLYGFNRRAAAKALASFGPVAESAAPSLLGAMTDRKSRYESIDFTDVVPYAAMSLARIGPAGHRALVEATHHDDVRVRFWAVRAMGEPSGPDPATVAALRVMLRDPSWMIQLQAILSLSQVGPVARPARDDVATFLRSGRPELKEGAGRALSAIGAD